MKIDYNKLLELNREALTDRGDQLASFWVVQSGVERFLHGDELSDVHKNLLIDLGILIESGQEERKKIVEPFKMNMGNDRPQSN